MLIRRRRFTQPFYVAEPYSKRKGILEAMNKTYGGEFRLTLGHPAQVASMTRGQRNADDIIFRPEGLSNRLNCANKLALLWQI